MRREVTTKRPVFVHADAAFDRLARESESPLEIEVTIDLEQRPAGGHGEVAVVGHAQIVEGRHVSGGSPVERSLTRATRSDLRGSSSSAGSTSALAPLSPARVPFHDTTKGISSTGS